MSFDQLASVAAIDAAKAALTANGVEVFVVESGEAAKAKALEIIPHGSEVMTMTSVTTDSIGLTAALDTPEYDNVKNKLSQMSRDTQHSEMQKLGAAPTYAVGSVHAVTEQGQLVIASNTGSQLPAYAYGSEHVIWVVGTQKIVKNLDEALQRINEYVLPLESERARQAYGVPGSNVSKLLIINKEVTPGRCHVILVKEKLGY